MSVIPSTDAVRPLRFRGLDIAPPAQPPSADRPRVAPPMESAAFEQYVLPHLDAAYNLALWLTRDATLAGNVVQDTALRAVGRLTPYRGSDPRAWFLRIVRGATLDAIAARRPSAAAELDNGDGLSCLGQAIASLALNLRECLVLRDMEGLTYREIATITGVPIRTTMSRLWHARDTLLKDDRWRTEDREASTA